MDPLSITASVIAVLTLTTALTTYLHDVRQATSDQKKLAIEACNLCSLLTNLRYRVEEASSDDVWFNQVKLLGGDHGPLGQFKNILEKMVAQITTSGTGARLKSALTWRWTKSELNEALEQIERLKTLITIALTNDAFQLSQAIYAEVTELVVQTSGLRLDVEQLKLDTSRDLQERLSRWLQVSDPSPNFQAARAKRHSQTGSWFLESPQLRDWRSSAASFLWLCGNGCGKTVLSATVLQALRVEAGLQPTTVVGYFFFDFNHIEKQQSRSAIRSLLFQLALQLPDCLQALQQLYQQCDNGQQQPSEDNIRSMLCFALTVSRHTYIVLDALDECTDREMLLPWIYELAASQEHQACILATSRRERDIEEQLKDIADHVINIQGSEVDNDIFVYVQDRLATDPRLKKWPTSVKDEIASEVKRKANGMFQWAYCQLEALRKCIKPSALKKVLSSLPETLDETYARIIRNIELNGQLSDAVIILRWLCFSNRPLQLAEVVDILAIENGEKGGFSPEERLPDPEDIMVVCSSLINCVRVQAKIRQEEHQCHLVLYRSAADYTYDEVNRPLPASERQDDNIEVRLAHFSVKEYLLSDRCCLRSDFTMQTCHGLIAESCLRYMLDVSEISTQSNAVRQQYPLISYAAEQWWQHAKNMDSISECTGTLMWRLLTKETALLMWVRHYNVDQPWNGYDSSLTASSLASPLYYAASTGLSEFTGMILGTKALRELLVDRREGYYGTALQAASLRGYEKVVRILLDHGSNVNIQGGEYGNALEAASSRGHEAVVQILLENGAIAEGALYKSALSAASERGHKGVVQLLLDWYADWNADWNAPRKGCAALYRASYNGHADVVQILLNRGVNVLFTREFVDSSLMAASSRGHGKVVRLLLDYGGNVNHQEEGAQNPLLLASQAGHEQVAQILLRSGADVNAEGGVFGNALYAASEVGHEKVVKVLLEHGADVNIQGGIYGSALQVASFRGYEEIVRVLLDGGAEVNTQGGRYGNALQAAALEGHEKVVQMLLRQGANVNAQGGRFNNALQAASMNHHKKVTQMLLKRGADVNMVFKFDDPKI